MVQPGRAVLEPKMRAPCLQIRVDVQVQERFGEWCSVAAVRRYGLGTQGAQSAPEPSGSQEYRRTPGIRSALERSSFGDAPSGVPM
jgi:hypothetical protein